MDEAAANRKDNLNAIAEALGNWSELARMTGISLSSLQAIKYGRPDKQGKPRSMGDNMAWKIESTFGLDAGSMSCAHGPEWATVVVVKRPEIPVGKENVSAEKPRALGNQQLADELRAEARKLIEQGTRLLALADRLAK